MKALGVSPQEVNSILESKRKAVLQGRGLDEAEEEAALVQLGIQVKKANSMAAELASMSTNTTNSKEEDEWDDDDGDDEWDKAAAERRKEAMEKSPFVAEVIEANCPGIADADKNQNATEMVEQLQETAEQLLQPEASEEETIQDLEAISKNETNAFQ